MMHQKPPKYYDMCIILSISGSWTGLHLEVGKRVLAALWRRGNCNTDKNSRNMIRTHSYTPTACDTCRSPGTEDGHRLSLPATWLPIKCQHHLIVDWEPSSQDRPTLPSSVKNTWDGLLLPTQPLGSYWCAWCCGLMCPWKEVLLFLFHWEATCIGRRTEAEATCLRACRKEVLLFNWEDKSFGRRGDNTSAMRATVSGHSASSTTLIWMLEAVWGGCQPQPWRNDIILTPQET